MNAPTAPEPAETRQRLVLAQHLYDAQREVERLRARIEAVERYIAAEEQSCDEYCCIVHCREIERLLKGKDR